MNYIDILLKLNKLKTILFAIFLVFLSIGYYLQKTNSKYYEFYFDIYFPSGSFLIFTAKQEIYNNFQESILTELAKKNYKIKKKPEITNAYKISLTIEGNNSGDFTKKKKEIIDLFQRQKKNLIRWITNNYNITNITLKELPEVDSQVDNIRKIKLELMWINLEKEYVSENISEEINLIFPEKLNKLKLTNYYAVMIVLYIALIALFISYLIVTEDFRKKLKKKKIK